MQDGGMNSAGVQ